MSAKPSTMTREEAIKRVAKAIVRNSKIRLRAQADGSTSVVVALPNEHVSEVVSRVRATGGGANVVVAFASHFSLMRMGFPAEPGDTTPVIEVNQDLSMGMFLIRVQHNPGKTIKFKFKDVDTEVPTVDLEVAYS